MIQKFVKLKRKRPIMILIISILLLKEFKKLTAKYFKERLKQADLVNQLDLNNKLMTLDKKFLQTKQKI